MRRPVRRRRVVLLVDVSGSMSSYADALLRLELTLEEAFAGKSASIEIETLQPCEPCLRWW